MQHYYRALDPVETGVRFDTDPRIAVTEADCAAIDAGRDYTPTDLKLIKAGTHPNFVVGVMSDRLLTQSNLKCSWCGPGECFCPDGPKTAEDCAPPCEKCNGKGRLVALYPNGQATFTCTACGGCGVQL